MGRSWLNEELVYRSDLTFNITAFCLFSVCVEVRRELLASGWLELGLFYAWFCCNFDVLASLSFGALVVLVLVGLRVSFWSCCEFSLMDAASTLCLAGIDPWGRVVDIFSWLTESSRCTLRNFRGAVALKISFSALLDCILLAPDDLGLDTLAVLIILLLLTLYWVCSNLFSVWVNCANNWLLNDSLIRLL